MHRSLLLAASAFCFSSAISSAALVITIDISNPSSTVIRAVANNSQSNGTRTVNYDGGISIIDFFTANTGIPLSSAIEITGSWKASGTLTPYSETVAFIYGSGAVVAGRSLSIYNENAAAGDLQIFNTSTIAFTGTSTLNLAGVANLPAVGTTGNINLGYQSSHGGVIGQWEVIPEPSSLLIASAGLLTLLRRRR